MSRVLVMGAASLVGSHLCDRLVRDGDEVLGVDDLSAGSFSNLAHLKREPRFAFIEHDVTQPFHADVDAVFHMALPSSRRRFEDDPVRATVTGVMGTLHALESARERGARIVLVTSPERFGEGVRSAEALAGDVVRSHGIDVRFVRVPAPYGPRLSIDDPGVIVRTALQALRGEPVDPGVRPQHPERLAYVDDIVETLVRTLHTERRTPPLVAPYIDTTARAVVRAVRSAVEAMKRGGAGGEELDGLPLSRDAASAREPLSPTMPDALPASLVLGLPPPVALEDGVLRTVRWLWERAVGPTRRDSRPPPLARIVPQVR